MELLVCKHCGSSLLNINAVTLKHDEYAERNVSIKKEYLTVKELQAIKHYFRCFSCGKTNELVLKNQAGCVSFEMRKGGIPQPRNEILGIEEGGRFN